MSAKVVVPDSIISTAASRVPMRTISGETVLASAGKMYFCSQSISARSSASPRYITIGAWVCVLMSPGRMISSRASRVSDARYFAAMAAGVPTSTMSRPSMATAPGDTTSRVAFCVMTVPPRTTRVTLRRTGCATRAASPRAAMLAAENGFIEPDSIARDSAPLFSPSSLPAFQPSSLSAFQPFSLPPFQPFHLPAFLPSRLPAFLPSCLPAFLIVYSDPVPVHIVAHPLVHDALVSLRDKHTTPEHFRRAATRISVLLATVALSDLPARDVTVETPLGPAPGRRIGADVVVVPVLRAGLGMLDAVLELVPGARVG